MTIEQQWRQESHQEGKLEGKAEGKLEVAQRLLDKNQSLETIM